MSVPLTHVYYWEPEIGYRPISVEEADKLYSHGETVSVDKTSRFVCGLCAQHVGLSKKRKGTGTRHFYHSRGEQNKECEDRAQAYARVTIGYSYHPMPMRIKVHRDSYLLELGFFRAPSSNVGGPSCQTIRITGENSQEFVHSFERVSSEGITYLNIGNIPCSVYHLAYEHPSPNLERYWPSTTSGVNPKGSFFEESSGKMLHAGGKAYPFRKYFLLQKYSLTLVPPGISYRKIAETKAGTFTTWHLYEINVLDFNASVARFFLERSIFLTEKPVQFYPVWPPYIEDPYFLYHSGSTMYFYLHGRDAELNLYPSVISPRYIELDNGRLYKLFSSSKEQLLSLGPFGSIEFSYLMKKDLSMEAALPQIQIKSIDGKLMEHDVLNQLPKENQITVQAPFDGKIVVLRNGHIQEIRHIIAMQELTVDGISYGLEIQIFQNCDLVCSICFQKLQQSIDYAEQDRMLLDVLRNCRGSMVSVPHSIGSSTKLLARLPLSRQWVYQAIRCGKMPMDAKKILMSYQYTKVDGKNNG